MKKTVAIFFFCLIVCTVSVLFGQQYQSQSIITTEQGLSQNTVRSILLDSRGFLWFATKDGLNKFDGYSFTVYRHSPKFLNSLSNNQVSSLLEDKQGNIWIGTDEGLNKFDPSSGIFSIYLHDTLNNNSISNNSIISLYEDRSGILWIGTRKGLNRFNPVNGSIERVQISLLNPAVSDCSIINSIYQSEDSSLWVGTAACGVFRLDCKTSLWSKVHFLTSDLRNEYNPIVGPIIQDRFGTIWIGTYGGGLFMLDTQKGMLKSFKSGKINPGGIRSAFVTALVHLNDSSIIVICRNTIDILNVRTHSVNSLSMNEYQAASLSLLIDNSGILWIGTDGSGIYKLIPVRKSFRIVRMSDSTRSGLSFSSVRSIYQDSDGELWVGGYIGVNKKQWMHPQETTGFSRNEWELVSPLSGVMPFCFVEDPFEKKELWIGTEGGGVIRFNKQTGIKTIYFKKGTEHFFPSAYCMRILVTRTKKIFFGAKTGLYRWNPDTSGFDSFTHEPENKFSINEGAVKALCEDNEGKLWVGTMKSGISIFNPSTNKFERFTSQRNVPTSLSDNHVNVIYQDAQGTMWVGTSAGLNKFNSTERTFYTYSIADGLPNDCIYGILEDERGNLWLSTNRGISMFNPSTEQFTNYDRFDGLQGDEFNSHAYFKNTRGEMFFGGLNGFTVFFPNEIQFNPT
ncbi:MAG: hypothetical protein HYZ34_10835, partial [Ignavibacteriae bacterium]|nr:hypothetical protein [Ignavibacteriota bacterium]